MKGAITFLVLTFIGAAAASYETGNEAIVVFWFLAALAGVLVGTLLVEWHAGRTERLRNRLR